MLFDELDNVFKGNLELRILVSLDPVDNRGDVFVPIETMFSIVDWKALVESKDG